MIAHIIKIAILAAATICAAVAAQSTQDTLFSSTTGTPYEVEIDSLSLTDVATGVKDIATIHNNRPFNVIATLKWNQEIYNLDSSNSLEWVLFVDGVYQSDGTVDLNEHRALPTTLEAGTATVYNSGSHNIAVKIKVDDMKNENERDYESFASGASFVPLLMVMIFAATTHMVELSLGMGIFVGSCMVAGTLTAGFRNMLDVYLVNAVRKKDHAYVFLFILFMAGLVGLIEKSGGLRGITKSLKKYVKTSRSAQAASLFSGVIIFFDDYANTLVAGASMRSLADACGVSREKLDSLLMPHRLQSLQSSPYLLGLVLKLDLFRNSLLQSWNKTQIQTLPQLASEFSSRLFNTATTASSCSSCFHFLWYREEIWDPC